MTAKEKIGVVGAGLMGREIALVFALAGHEVLLTDRSETALSEAMDRLRSILGKGIERGLFQPAQKDAALAQIATTADLQRFADRDYVTEAVFEQEQVKAEVYRQLDTICAAGCIFATNTSTIPISALASYVATARRPNCIGTHYFSPVSRIKLVEVIPGFDTAVDAMEEILVATVAGRGPAPAPAVEEDGAKSGSDAAPGMTTRAMRKTKALAASGAGFLWGGTSITKKLRQVVRYRLIQRGNAMGSDCSIGGRVLITFSG